MLNGRHTDRVKLFAWVRQTNGDPTIQNALLAGYVPLVSTRRDQIDRRGIYTQLQQLADVHNTEIRLVHCIEVDTLGIVRPRTRRPKT
jgi:hypothetical protein